MLIIVNSVFDKKTSFDSTLMWGMPLTQGKDLWYCGSKGRRILPKLEVGSPGK